MLHVHPTLLLNYKVRLTERESEIIIISMTLHGTDIKNLLKEKKWKYILDKIKNFFRKFWLETQIMSM